LIGAVFWDNDGVLVDSEKLYLQASRELLREAGIELTHEQFLELSLRQGRSVFVLATEAGVAPERVEALREQRNRRYAELLRGGVEVMPGVRDALQRLRGQVDMAIVTSSQPDHFELIHARTELLEHFEFVLTGADFTRFKPHPEPYLMAAERLGLAPEQCLVIEDTRRGLTSALAAGMRCAVIPHALTRDEDFSGAWQVLQSADQVPPLLEVL
jgi:HAD superfamily hydrolase (TIGR01509 family)